MKKIFIVSISLTVAALAFSTALVAKAAPVELIENGSFEEPVVAASQNWDIFVGDSSAVPGWYAEWVDPTPASHKPDDAQIELHRGVNGWLPEDGDQYAELDSDWDGPGGSINNEPASIILYQDLATCPGEEYEIKFYFSPRPGTTESNNVLEFYWNGSLIDTISAAGGSQTNWSEHSYNLAASGNTTRIEFKDAGTSDSFGTFLDNVSVVGETQPCPVCCAGDVKVNNFNWSMVRSNVTVVSNTGYNSADGGDGDDGGDGAEAEAEYGSHAISFGSGGSGGRGGSGGTITTGDSYSKGKVINRVNSNFTRIRR